MKTQAKTRSLVPPLAVGLTFLIYACSFEFYRPGDYFKAAIWALVVFVVTKLIFKDKVEITETVLPEETGLEAADKLLAQGRNYIAQMDTLNDRIVDAVVSAKIEELKRQCLLLFDEIKAYPEKASRIRRSVEYVIPTAIGLLEKYAQYQNAGSSGANAAAMLGSINSSLDMLAKAFAKQLDDLRGDQALNVKSEIAALEIILEREGLHENNKSETIKD